MIVLELIDLLGQYHPNREVRIGDHLGAGPYSHDRVGGVWASPNHGDGLQYVILCAEDTSWVDENPQKILPLVWSPSPPLVKS